MADQKVTALTENTTPQAEDVMYLVDDPGGTPASRKVTLENLLSLEYSAVNLIKNSPGQIVTDGAEPQWWDDVANAAITDEDTAGETPPDIHERCFKVVTSANDVYGYQTLTFADEALLDAGVTVVSAGCWAYCATGSKASIGLYGTNMGLTESSQAGAGAFQWLTVENLTLDASDTAIEFRLIVDTDTSWFTMPMLNTGPRAMPWVPRGLQFVPRQSVTQYDLNTTGDVAWSDTDCTANTDALATLIQFWVYTDEPDGSATSYHSIGHNDTVLGADTEVLRCYVNVVAFGWASAGPYVLCDDSQVIRYQVQEADADNDVRAILYLVGYWRWAP